MDTDGTGVELIDLSALSIKLFTEAAKKVSIFVRQLDSKSTCFTDNRCYYDDLEDTHNKIIVALHSESGWMVPPYHHP